MASKLTSPRKPESALVSRRKPEPVPIIMCQSDRHVQTPRTKMERHQRFGDKLYCQTCYVRNEEERIENARLKAKLEKLRVENLEVENANLKAENEKLRRESLNKTPTVCQSSRHVHTANSHSEKLFEGPDDKWRCAVCHKPIVDAESTKHQHEEFVQLNRNAGMANKIAGIIAVEIAKEVRKNH